MGLDSEANKCFVCGPGNPDGLQLRFRLEDGVCRTEWTPAATYMGYDGVTHGGILFSLLDDVMANMLFLQGEVCYTARAEIRFRAALPIGTPIRLEARLAKRRGRLVILHAQAIRQDSGEVVVESTGRFMVEPE